MYIKILALISCMGSAFASQGNFLEEKEDDKPRQKSLVMVKDEEIDDSLKRVEIAPFKSWVQDWGSSIKNTIYWYTLSGKKRPTVFEVTTEYPELLVLENNFEGLKEELLNLLVDNKKQSFAQSSLEKTSDLKEGIQLKSRMILLKNCGFIPQRNKETCPKTLDLLNQLSMVEQAYFTILEDRQPMLAHASSDMSTLLYMLPFLASPIVSTKLMVNEMDVPWREGKSIIFDHSWSYEVANKSKEPQIALIMVIKRKLSKVQSYIKATFDNPYLAGYSYPLEEDLRKYH